MTMVVGMGVVVRTFDGRGGAGCDGGLPVALIDESVSVHVLYMPIDHQ